MAKKITATVKTTAPTIQAFVNFTVGAAREGRRDRLVGQFTRLLDCVGAGAMEAKGADVKIVYALIVDKIGDDDASAVNVATTRASEAASVLKLHEFKCHVALFKLLKGDEFKALTFEKLVKIARWMRGPHGSNGAWEKSLAAPPKVADIVKAMDAEAKAETPTTSSSRKGNVVGMPGAADRGLEHIVKCIKAFEKAHAKDFANAKDKALVTAMLNNCDALKAPVKALIKQREKKDAAK